MKIEDLKTNDIIACYTIEESDKIRKLFINLGLEWGSGRSYEDPIESESYIKDGGVGYNPKLGMHSRIEYYKENKKYTLYPSSLFLNHSPNYEIY